ncbi:MAG: RNA-binding protein [Chitinophagaceae bacterium]|nr:MAG: RNA-binding protein [Chitinophagaceae bacterium]
MIKCCCLKRSKIYIIFLCVLCSCHKKETLFTLLTPDQTRIHFENKNVDTGSLNILDYLYYYNGGGVALGDVNGDGLVDIYVTSNTGGNKLYLNEGNFKFKDVTKEAGVCGRAGWTTGVTMADVNGDGRLDIYVCTVGGYKNFKSHNELFINTGNDKNGVPVFKEEAHQWGIDDTGFSTQAVFFDYNHDGKPDMFLLQHSVHSLSNFGDTSLRHVYSVVSGGKLYRNDGHHFTDVTKQAGIISSALGFGLGVTVGDLNNDGWPDIYVSNDFQENDYYYLNNGNGTFTEVNGNAFGHESRSSMGNDIADFNNDGWLDIITLDMLPQDEKVLKSTATDDPEDVYEYKKHYGFTDQYVRNCLQMNTDGGKRFSEVGLMTGVAATDWSWSPLMADFNNDGIKDLFISNGIKRRENDLDYINYISNDTVAFQLQATRNLDQQVISKMPEGKVHNYMFEGTKSMIFKDVSSAWGFSAPTLSNGAAYADLNNDGNLDLVVNNINAPLAIYRNNTRALTHRHYIKIECKGDDGNTFGIGAKILLINHGKLQYNYVKTTCGFQSSIDPSVFFGLDKDTVIDTLLVIWPNQKSQLLQQVKADQTLVLEEQHAHSTINLLPHAVDKNKAAFADVTDSMHIPYKHKEDAFDDFKFQHLIPHKVSTEGPKIAVTDVNGDGLQDFYVCGAKGQPGELFMQQPDGKFIRASEPAFDADTLSDQTDAIFFDANGDGYPDLYIVSGGNEVEGKNPALLDHLYLNDGKGHFTLAKNPLPVFYGSKSCAAAADYEGNGHTDLFVGGRVVAGDYGAIPESHLLINDGHGRFKDMTGELAPGLKHIGMVTDAVWTDFDGDGKKDLILVGEWMPVTFFKNMGGGRLKNVTAQMNLPNTNGWWRTIKVADVNGDGKPDLLLGNYGINSKLAPIGPDYPLKLYVSDFDHNGTPDQILAYAKNGKYYTFLGKDALQRQMPSLIGKKYTSYHAFAGQTVEQIFGKSLQETKVLNAYTFKSMLLLNEGKGHFIEKPLPFAAQVAPVYSFETGDFNHDGKMDVLVGGNFYGVIPYEGRYDANDGVVLYGNGKGNFKAAWPWQTGFYLKGEVRDIKTIQTKKGAYILVAGNNDSLQVFMNR